MLTGGDSSRDTIFSACIYSSEINAFSVACFVSELLFVRESWTVFTMIHFVFVTYEMDQ
jgi:hypothetical protein